METARYPWWRRWFKKKLLTEPEPIQEIIESSTEEEYVDDLYLESGDIIMEEEEEPIIVPNERMLPSPQLSFIKLGSKIIPRNVRNSRRRN